MNLECIRAPTRRSRNATTSAAVTFVLSGTNCLGTGEVESATSYLARLAIAHTVSTWSLLKSEIAPRLFGSDASSKPPIRIDGHHGERMQWRNQTSSKLISILRSLTGREDLIRITMGLFAAGSLGRGSRPRCRAWCGACLSEWKATGREMYLPLLWHLMAGLKVCPSHGTPLQTPVRRVPAHSIH